MEELAYLIEFYDVVKARKIEFMFDTFGHFPKYRTRNGID